MCTWVLIFRDYTKCQPDRNQCAQGQDIKLHIDKKKFFICIIIHRKNRIVHFHLAEPRSACIPTPPVLFYLDSRGGFLFPLKCSVAFADKPNQSVLGELVYFVGFLFSFFSESKFCGGSDNKNCVQFNETCKRNMLLFRNINIASRNQLILFFFDFE